MEIYILRHGVAEEPQTGQPDSERALTPDGRKKLRNVLRTASSAGVAPSLILTSPYKRALQTAQLAAEILEAYQGQGNAIRKRDEVHKMAQANKAFAHFRW